MVQSLRFELLDALQPGVHIADRHLVHVADLEGRRARRVFGANKKGDQWSGPPELR